MPQYPYKTITFGIEFELIVATVPLLSRIPYPRYNPENRPIPPTNIWRYPDGRKQAEEYRDLDFFETARPVTQQLADVLKNRGIPAYPWFRQNSRSLIRENE